MSCQFIQVRNFFVDLGTPRSHAETRAPEECPFLWCDKRGLYFGGRNPGEETHLSM
jgi:hypothetical protein